MNRPRAADVHLMLMAGILVAVDQAAKYLVRARFFPGETFSLTPFLHLTYLTNTGVAFSMFQGKNLLFAGLGLVAVAVFLLWYFRNRSSLTAAARTAFFLIIAGAVGNLIDRLVHGHVVDFIDVGIGRYHWPSFNVADSCITVGGVMIALTLLRTSERK